MPRILRFAGIAGRAAFYLLIGIAGVVLITQGEPIGWIAAGLSGALAGLRIMNTRLGRRQRELAAREAIRRAEPGYVAPIVDPAESSRRRSRRVKILVLGVVGPFFAIAIAATWIALVSTGDLQKWAVVIGIATLFSASAMILGLHRGLSQTRDKG